MELAKPPRVFLVGCLRSGTTLLQSLLSAHPQITSCPETMFFMYLVGQWSSRWFGAPPSNLAERLGRPLSSTRVQLGIAHSMGRQRVHDFLADIGREDLTVLFPTRSRSLKRQIDGCLQILDRLAQEEQKPLWIEKSPVHVAYMDVIERYVQPVRFLHIVRNGTDVIASMYDAAQRYPQAHWGTQYNTIDACIAQWKHCVRLTQRNLGKPNHRMVTYERLVEDTPTVLQEICDFLGCAFDPAMLQNYGEAAGRVVLEREAWKSGAFATIRNSNSTKFYELFDARQRQYILDQLADIQIDEPRYPPVEVSVSAG